MTQVTEDEKQKLAEAYWLYVEAVGHSNRYLNEAYPSIIACIDTQFSGQGWYPDIIGYYTQAVFTIVSLMDDTDQPEPDQDNVYRMDGWTGVASPERQRESADAAAARYFPELAHEEHERITALLHTFREKSISEEAMLAEMFSLLSLRPYTFVIDRKSTEDILTVFYPTDQFDEGFIRDTYIPGYLEACEQDEKGMQAWKADRRAESDLAEQN